MPFFTEKITSRKDIVNGSFLDFFGSHVFWYIFSHIIFWYIFLVSCSKGGWLAPQSTPLPWIRPCFCEVYCHFLFQCTSLSLLLSTRTLSTLSVKTQLKTRTSVSKNLFQKVGSCLLYTSDAADE